MSKKRDLAAWKDNAVKLGIFEKLSATEKKYGIPEGVLTGLAEQESDHFDPDVISGKRKSRAGAIGLMQFMKATAKDEGVDPLNLDSAIDGGGKYLKKLYDQTGSWSGALTSYNWGIGNYKKWLNGKKKTIPSEARNYAPAVLSRAKNYGSMVPVSNTTGPSDAQNTLVKGDLIPKIPDVPAPEVPQQPDLVPRSRPTSISSVNTPAGTMQVIPESPIEENLITQLNQSGETQLLTNVPELLRVRDKFNQQNIVPRNDTMDQLLGEIIDRV